MTPNPLVPVSSICTRVNDLNTVVLDATLPPVGVKPPIDTRARYLAKHIPGALFFDIEKYSDRSSSLPHMLPAPETFARMMSALGVGSDMHIFIYEQEGVFSAPRAWWMLRTFGARNVYILDGGLRAWLEAGLPTQAGAVQRVATRFDARFDTNAVKNFVQIQQMLSGRTQILDARSVSRFNGAAPEPRPGLRSGHMPGAISLPFGDLIEEGRMKPAEKLRELFAAKGVSIEQPITTTCGSGVTAAVIALGLEIAGARKVSLYDGSWAEYALQREAVIEKSE